MCLCAWLFVEGQGYGMCACACEHMQKGMHALTCFCVSVFSFSFLPLCLLDAVCLSLLSRALVLILLKYMYLKQSKCCLLLQSPVWITGDCAGDLLVHCGCGDGQYDTRWKWLYGWVLFQHIIQGGRGDKPLVYHSWQAYNYVREGH